MAYVILTPGARRDPDELFDFIAVENQSPETAAHFLRALQAKCEHYAREPLLGESRPDIEASIRVFPHKSYIILYRPCSSGIELIRVLHGARNFYSLF